MVDSIALDLPAVSGEREISSVDTIEPVSSRAQFMAKLKMFVYKMLSGLRAGQLNSAPGLQISLQNVYDLLEMRKSAESLFHTHYLESVVFLIDTVVEETKRLDSSIKFALELELDYDDSLTARPWLSRCPFPELSISETVRRLCALRRDEGPRTCSVASRSQSALPTPEPSSTCSGSGESLGSRDPSDLEEERLREKILNSMELVDEFLLSSDPYVSSRQHGTSRPHVSSRSGTAFDFSEDDASCRSSSLDGMHTPRGGFGLRTGLNDSLGPTGSLETDHFSDLGIPCILVDVGADAKLKRAISSCINAVSSSRTSSGSTRPESQDVSVLEQIRTIVYKRLTPRHQKADAHHRAYLTSTSFLSSASHFSVSGSCVNMQKLGMASDFGGASCLTPALMYKVFCEANKLPCKVVFDPTSERFVNLAVDSRSLERKTILIEWGSTDSEKEGKDRNGTNRHQGDRHDARISSHDARISGQTVLFVADVQGSVERELQDYGSAFKSVSNFKSVSPGALHLFLPTVLGASGVYDRILSSGQVESTKNVSLAKAFKFESMLGQGSFGQVWQVKLKLPRELAEDAISKGMICEKINLGHASGDLPYSWVSRDSYALKIIQYEEDEIDSKKDKKRGKLGDKGKGSERSPVRKNARTANTLDASSDVSGSTGDPCEEADDELIFASSLSHDSVCESLAVFQAEQKSAHLNGHKVIRRFRCVLMPLAELGSLETQVTEDISGSTSRKVPDPIATHPLGRRVNVLDIYKSLADVARGLQYMHSKGVIHRDIKPGNILLRRHSSGIKETRDGRGWSSQEEKDGSFGLTSSRGVSILGASPRCLPICLRGQVCDLGLARPNALFETNLTQSPGTVEFMAPEQRTSMYDSRVDVYAFGKVIEWVIARTERNSVKRISDGSRTGVPCRPSLQRRGSNEHLIPSHIDLMIRGSETIDRASVPMLKASSHERKVPSAELKAVGHGKPGHHRPSLQKENSFPHSGNSFPHSGSSFSNSGNSFSGSINSFQSSGDASSSSTWISHAKDAEEIKGNCVHNGELTKTTASVALLTSKGSSRWPIPSSLGAARITDYFRPKPNQIGAVASLGSVGSLARADSDPLSSVHSRIGHELGAAHVGASHLRDTSHLREFQSQRSAPASSDSHAFIPSSKPFEVRVRQSLTPFLDLLTSLSARCLCELPEERPDSFSVFSEMLVTLLDKIPSDGGHEGEQRGTATMVGAKPPTIDSVGYWSDPCKQVDPCNQTNPSKQSYKASDGLSPLVTSSSRESPFESIASADSSQSGARLRRGQNIARAQHAALAPKGHNGVVSATLFDPSKCASTSGSSGANSRNSSKRQSTDSENHRERIKRTRRCNTTHSQSEESKHKKRSCADKATKRIQRGFLKGRM